MSEVAGMYELEDLACYALNDHPDPDEWKENKDRLEALLRNRQELIEALSDFENDDGRVPETIWRNATSALAKAKELDNE